MMLSHERLPGPLENEEPRLEELRFMERHHETIDGATARIGMSRDALQKLLHRHDRDLWDRFIENGRLARE